jgi:hypothetical protein
LQYFFATEEASSPKINKERDMSRLNDWYKTALRVIDQGDSDSPKYAIAAALDNGSLKPEPPEWLEYGNWQIWDSANPFKAINLKD